MLAGGVNAVLRSVQRASEAQEGRTGYGEHCAEEEKYVYADVRGRAATGHLQTGRGRGSDSSQEPDSLLPP